jgi:predicted small lipoprotein YifL
MPKPLQFAMALLVVAGLGLSACGRKGPLEAPPSQRSSEGAPVAETESGKPDRPFILDGLLR